MTETDYLILGGGLAGCVLASRLKQYLPNASVTVLEAGKANNATAFSITDLVHQIRTVNPQ